jgi:hypothetical protein
MQEEENKKIIKVSVCRPSLFRQRGMEKFLSYARWENIECISVLNIVHDKLEYIMINLEVHNYIF